MFKRFVSIVLASIAFCCAIFLQTCSHSQHIDGTVNWEEFKDKVKIGSPESIDPNNEGELVYLTGTLIPEEYIEDEKYGVAYKGLSLKRRVQIYQWKEVIKTINNRKAMGPGSGRTSGRKARSKTSSSYEVVSYQKVWSPIVIDHSNFRTPEGHENRTIHSIVKDKTILAEFYQLGKFKVYGSIFNRIPHDTIPLLSENTQLNLLPKYISEFTDSGLHVYQNIAEKEIPQIGNIRIVYTTSNKDIVSLFGTQIGNHIYADHEKSKERSLIAEGAKTLDEMVQSEMNSLEESSSWSICFSIFFVYISMLFIDSMLTEKLGETQLWSLFINFPILISAAINTLWCYLVLYLICSYYHDFSQVLFTILGVYISFFAFFTLWLVVFGRKEENMLK